ncbi:putative S-layer protein [Candidatus Pacearchaeota archaeon]|nr:putative S-layer protein [Candidatus Pacearchaeota archaeon]
MKTSLFTRTILIFVSLLFLAASASAALTLTPVQVPNSIAPGQDVQVRYNISSDANYTSLDWSASTTSDSTKLVWKNLASLPININAGTTQEITAVLNAKSHSIGSVSATLRVKNGTNPAFLASHTSSLSINETSGLSVSGSPALLTSRQNGTININNTGNSNSPIILSTSGALNLTLSSKTLSISPGASQSVLVSPGNTGALPFGTHTGTVLVNQGSASASTIFSFQKTFCSSGTQGTNLSISRVDITSSGDDDEEWKPLDIVTIRVRVDNDGNNDLKDVVVRLGLFDGAGVNVANDLDFNNKDEDEITIDRINDNDEETVEFEFTVPGDMDTGDYKLSVKAFSEKVSENLLCADTSSDFETENIYTTISIDREDEEGRFINFDDIDLSPTQATCGDAVTLSADVFNVGEDDQDRVRVILRNRELSLDMSQELRQGLDIGDDDRITFSFTVPRNVQDKDYTLELDADYDYSGGDYDQSLDETKKVLLTVFGCTPGQPVTGAVASINAELVSDEVLAGKELLVRAKLTNLANQTTTFVVSPKGYESWADLTRTSDRLVTLRTGESKDITFTFDVNEDVTGEQTFTIEASNGNRAQTQEVAVEFAEERARSDVFSDNKLIWVIGIVNIILIILIIVVAIKISQR